MLGREVRQMASKKFSSKRGAKLILQHGTAASLGLNQTLQEQGIVSDATILSCTYMPANLYDDAWCFIQELATPEEEFALEGLTHLTLKMRFSLCTISPKALKAWLLILAPMRIMRAWMRCTWQLDFRRWRLAIASTRAWSDWPCRPVFNRWVLAKTFGRHWMERLCHPIFKRSFFVGASTKASKLRASDPAVQSSNLDSWQQLYQNLERVTCHLVFNRWLLGLTSTTAWSEWPCCPVFRRWFLGMTSTRAWSKWPCHPVFRPWLLDTFGSNFNHSLKGVLNPDTLEDLFLGWSFQQDLDGANVPSTLQTLGFRERAKGAFGYAKICEKVRTVITAVTLR